MKNLILALLALAPQVVFATQDLGSCKYSVWKNDSGTLLSWGNGYFRKNAPSLLPFSNSASRFQFMMIAFNEENTSPGGSSTSFSLDASRLPGDAFYNSNGMLKIGATFGDRKIFGTLECEAPAPVAFYFVSPISKVLVEENLNGELRATLHQNGTCAAGDLSKAAAYLMNTLSTPVYVVTSSKLVWTETEKKCAEYSNSMNEHGFRDCLRYVDGTKQSFSVPACAANQ